MALVAAGLLVFATHATAYVYWTDTESGTVARADLNGENVNQSFISGGGEPDGIVTDGGYIYWSNYSGGSIGRATLAGTEVNQDFITGLSEPSGLAASGGHLYWADFGTDSIARATLTGTELEPEFIPEAVIGHNVRSVAVSNGHLLWVAQNGATIGRANLSGGEVDRTFLSESGGEMWAVAASAGQLYWSDCGEEYLADPINRANLDGSEVLTGFLTGGGCPFGIATTASHLYWANGESIDRSGPDGEDAEVLIPGEGRPLAVTVTTSVTAVAEASPSVTLGQSIHDSVTLAGGSEPGGTVTFKLYAPTDSGCSAPPVYTSEIPVTGAGSYSSGSYTPTQTGTYHWAVVYSGDSNNEPTTLACGTAHQADGVTPAPTTTTRPPTATPESGPTACSSDRIEHIHWMLPQGVHLTAVEISVNGALYRRLPGAVRQATVSFVGRHAGIATVKIAGHTRSGTLYSDTRIYHPCATLRVRSKPARMYLLGRR